MKFCEFFAVGLVASFNTSRRKIKTAIEKNSEDTRIRCKNKCGKITTKMRNFGQTGRFFSSFFNVDERHRPQVNDIHYNINEIERLKAQGIDTSGFIVAEPTVDSRRPRATYAETYANEWTQTDPVDGKIVVAWSMMEDYPYQSETTQFMADLRTVQKKV